MKRNTCILMTILAMATLGAAPAMAQPHHGTRTASVITPAVSNNGTGHNWSGNHWNGHWHRHCHYSNFYFGTGFGYPGYGFGYPYGAYSPYDYGYYARPVVYQGAQVGTTGSVVAAVQQRLARAGYYHGAIDGVAGNQTRRAIRNYEHARGLPVDGRIDGELLAAMGIG